MDKASSFLRILAEKMWAWWLAPLLVAAAVAR